MEHDPDLEKIADLAEQIEALAAPLRKPERHLISNAAAMIRWACYRVSKPDDPDTEKALAEVLNGLNDIVLRPGGDQSKK